MDTGVPEEDPEPPLMSWKEVSSVSREPEEVLPREPSLAARKAFEAELEYDEFDLVATETMQSEYQRQERLSLNPEVLEEDNDEDNNTVNKTSVKRKGIPRYLRYPEKYKCYTLDEPITVSYTKQDPIPVQDSVSSEASERIVFRKTSDLKFHSKSWLRCRPGEGHKSIQAMEEDTDTSATTVQTAAEQSFKDQDLKQDSSSNEHKHTVHKTISRGSRNYRTKSKLS